MSMIKDIRVQRGILSKSVGHEVDGGDRVALPHQVQDDRRPTVDEDVLGPLLAAVVHALRRIPLHG